MRFAAAGISVGAGRWITALVSLAAFPASPTTRLSILGGAFMAGEGLTLVLAAIAAREPRNEAENNRDRRLTLSRALPFALNSLLGMAYNRFDVVILAALSTAVQLSLYAPASRIQDALYLIPSTIGVVSLPAVASVWSRSKSLDEVRHLTHRLLVLGGFISLPVTALVFVFAPALIQVVLGAEYAGAVGPTRVIVFFLPFACLQAPLLGALAGMGRARDTTKVFAMTFLTAIIMHASLDWWWGATGAAVASLARDPVALIVVVLLARRHGLLSDHRSAAPVSQPIP
jgi:O-antigen/teichoic acid export membrane protein